MSANSTDIKCPKCGTASFALIPIGQSFRCMTRCQNPECRCRFTIAAKPHAVRPTDTTISVGFTNTDKERNGSKRTDAGVIPLDITGLTAMPLNELHKLVSETEDFTSALISTYEQDLERLLNFYRRRKHAAESKRNTYVEEHKPREVVSDKPAKRSSIKADPEAKTKKVKAPAIDLSSYRQMLFGFLATMESAGHITVDEAKRLRADGVTEEGLMRVADRIGMPRVK